MLPCLLMSPGVYRKTSRRPLIRNMEASEQIEAFLVSGVLAVLGIRLYLELTGYPTIGGANLHIAHMLWGGILMLIALLVLLGFLGRGARWTGAILGGLGFGTFLDEVGKFVTHDNDYFYQPAIAIMHVVFVITYIAVRRILTARGYSENEFLVNALQELEELAVGDLDAEEKARALLYLDRVSDENPVVQPLRTLISQAKPVASPPPSLQKRIRTRVGHTYSWIAERPWFARGLILFFGAQLLVKLYQGVIVVLFFGLGRTGLADYRFTSGVLDNLSQLPVAGWGELFASLLAAALTLVGMVRIFESRLAGCYWFQRSILVSIFLTQVFMFYREQVSAVIGLFLNVSILIVLNYMIHAEEKLEKVARRDEACDPAPLSNPTVGSGGTDGQTG
ncbi:MAG: hypothetical protein KDA27_08795 [Candidatus Eisenbacteria bacterium]|uniref:Uncharacterized protein n=1 Tax=Eiseniibacteriota bacterium TaxID=2212470 RepID=A0A956SE27_UNCEI|nr:hypothetical protein [Candidatus Eisenbacteria bacterium]